MRNNAQEPRRVSKRAWGAIGLVLIVSSSMSAWSDSAYSSEQPIWRFDFRETFYDASFLDSRKAVLVGARGRILVTHNKYGNLWSPRDSGTKEVLTCLSFADERHGWAAGHGGIILHTSDGGETWDVQRKSSPDQQPLFDIEFVSAMAGVACGGLDTILRTTDGGRTWTPISTGLENNYHGLAFVESDTGYIVGEFGTVLKTTDGAVSWRRLELGGYRGSLFGITVLAANKILVYGIAGKIMRTEDAGTTWEDVSPCVQQGLFRGVAWGNEVVIVGGSGTILYSSDGGKSFTERKDEDLTSFAGVCAHPGGGFLCVGARGKITRIARPPVSEQKGVDMQAQEQEKH